MLACVKRIWRLYFYLIPFEGEPKINDDTHKKHITWYKNGQFRANYGHQSFLLGLYHPSCLGPKELTAKPRIHVTRNLYPKWVKCTWKDIFATAVVVVMGNGSSLLSQIEIGGQVRADPADLTPLTNNFDWNDSYRKKKKNKRGARQKPFTHWGCQCCVQKNSERRRFNTAEECDQWSIRGFVLF